MVLVIWRRLRSDRGNELIEAALILPLLLLIAVGIFEFGRAYQTEQILTNAAREGARLAVLPSYDDVVIASRVRDYLTNGGLSNAASVAVTINHNATIGGAAAISASSVTVNYPFTFTMLGPVASLVSKRSNVRGSFTMTAVATMRNETAN